MNRVDKINYYLDMAEVALERSTCLRRKWGAVIVKNDEIIATGYNGAPRGRKNTLTQKKGHALRAQPDENMLVTWFTAAADRRNKRRWHHHQPRNQNR